MIWTQPATIADPTREFREGDTELQQGPSRYLAAITGGLHGVSASTAAYCTREWRKAACEAHDGIVRLIGYEPEPAGRGHVGVPGHVREATTPGSLLPERPELAGLLLADCSCGAEYTVPEGDDEFGALEEAHPLHVAASGGHRHERG